MKCLTKRLGQIQCAKVPQCLPWNEDFFNTFTWVAIVPQSLHLPRQAKPLPPSQSKVLWTKERDDIRRQTTKRYGCGCSRFILPLLSKAFAWNHGKYSRITSSFFSYRWFLSNGLTVHHNITWHHRHWLRRFRWNGDNSVEECPPLNWKVVCPIRRIWVNRRSAAWARSFASTAQVRSIFQALACR